MGMEYKDFYAYFQVFHRRACYDILLGRTFHQQSAVDIDACSGMEVERLACRDVQRGQAVYADAAVDNRRLFAAKGGVALNDQVAQYFRIPRMGIEVYFLLYTALHREHDVVLQELWSFNAVLSLLRISTFCVW